MNSDTLRSYTIYRNPRDFPGKYVVRGFDLRSGPNPLPDPEPLAVVDTLEEAQAAIPPGLFNIHRFPADEPQIVETWI